jgi:hypothetical protein
MPSLLRSDHPKLAKHAVIGRHRQGIASRAWQLGCRLGSEHESDGLRRNFALDAAAGP